MQDEVNNLREALQDSVASDCGENREATDDSGCLLSTSKLTYFGPKAKSDGQLGVAKNAISNDGGEAIFLFKVSGETPVRSKSAAFCCQSGFYARFKMHVLMGLASEFSEGVAAAALPLLGGLPCQEGHPDSYGKPSVVGSPGVSTNRIETY